MPTIDQSLRPLEIITPLGANVLGLRSIHVHEQLSGGFTIDVELSSDNPDIKFDDIVGHPVGVRLNLPGEKQRYWHALVARFMTVEGTGHYAHYRAILVPWLWALTRSADCRIFQGKTYPDIVQEVFRDRGAKDFEVRLSGTHPKAEYCVQYRETDFNFVSRLLEQEGIAYYFKHDKNQGQLILADEKAAYETADGYANIVYRPNDEQGKQDAITSWNIEHEVQPTQYALSDYNPLKPKVSLVRLAKTERAYGMNDRQIFDYPGDYGSAAEAERLTNIRLDELQSAAEIVRAQTTALGLGAGNLFTLKDHPRTEQNRQYLITALTLSFDAGEFDSAGKSETQSSCSFSAIPAEQLFRPQRTTPKPVVHGPQPALVVGPAGEEIYTDEHGRVKVSFYWDRQSKVNETSSCWLRVAQGWAGKKWGGLFLPRIGHEVLVEFFEGDPDRPIVTGSVYNGENTPPYPLPAEKTKSTLKSNSSKGGQGFNEIRLEDKKGEEQIFIHGQKDLDIRVRNDVRETNYGNRDVRVGWEKDGNTGGNFNTLVRKDVNTHVQGSQFEQVDKVLNQVVKDDVAQDFQKNQTTIVKDTLSVHASEIIIEGAQAIHEKAGKIVIQGAQSVHIKGVQVAIEGTAAVSLKVGGSFVSINPDEVQIVGPKVMINSGGSALSADEAKSVEGAILQEPQAPKLADDGKTGQKSNISGKDSDGPMVKAFKPLVIQPTNPNISQKIQRRQERIKLISKARRPGASKTEKNAALRLENNMDAIEKARLAKDAYHWVRPEDCPLGWRRGSDNPEEIAEKYGIGLETLAPSDSSFRAEIYEPDPAIFGTEAKPVLVFKGTSGTADWMQANIPQGMGLETESYNRAMQLAKKLDRRGINYEIAGHSLGGGLASAASATSSGIRKTTTFNSAGLNAKTISRRGAELADANQTQAYRVDGELLTYVQEQMVGSSFFPDAIGEKHTLMAVGKPKMETLDLGQVAQERFDRHDMNVVIDSIEQEKSEDQAMLSLQK